MSDPLARRFYRVPFLLLFVLASRPTGGATAGADPMPAGSLAAVATATAGPESGAVRDAAPNERDRARAAVARLLDDSAADWNRGDLDAFCAHYAEDALFVSPSGMTRGRQAVRERYAKKYPDHAAMGTLGFEIVEVRLAAEVDSAGPEAASATGVRGASVVARWTLACPETAPSGGVPASRRTAAGLTLLVLRLRGDGRWEIVQDASM